MLFTKGLFKNARMYYRKGLFERGFKNVYYDEEVEVSPSSIKKTLTSHCSYFEEGHTCFIISCPVCNKPSKSSPPSKLYVNKITGSFSCPTCMSFGQWSNLEAFVSQKKSKKSGIKPLTVESEQELIQKYLERVESETHLVKHLPTSVVTKLLKKFNLPLTSEASISSIDTRTDSSEDRLYFPLNNVEARTVGYSVLSREGQKIEPTINCTGVLTGRPSPKCRDSAVLVPNISDFLVLLDSKIPNYIVCLPNGLKNLPQQVLPSLEKFHKLVLWFGNDLHSWDIGRNFARKLGEKRCLFVRPTDKQLLPHLVDAKDIKGIISAAQSIWHKSITTFSSLREDVLSELQNVEKVHGVKWKRYPVLNKILKGHRRGELTILTGPTGSGKTTLISEYSLDLAMQGVNTLWGSFEIRNVRLAKTMLQQMAGLPLEANLPLFDQFADDFEKLPIYYMTFHGEQPIKVVMEAVEHAQYVHDIAHVVIDNVQFMMGMSEEPKFTDRFWRQDMIIAGFRAFATRRNCHVTLVIHPRKERDDEDLTTSSIFGGAKASQEADNILLIQDKRLASIRGKKFLQVAKNRYTGDLGIMALDFDKGGLSFAPKKKKAEEKKEPDDKPPLES